MLCFDCTSTLHLYRLTQQRCLTSKSQINLRVCHLLLFCNKVRNNFLGVNCPTVERYLLYKRKFFGIMVSAWPRTHTEVYFKKLDILPVPCQYVVPLMNLSVNNEENFQTNLPVRSINTQTKCKSVVFSDKHLRCWHQNFQQFTT